MTDARTTALADYERDGEIVTLTLIRPDKLNAFSDELVGTQARTVQGAPSLSSAISRSFARWILKPFGEGVFGKSGTAKTRSGTL